MAPKFLKEAVGAQVDAFSPGEIKSFSPGESKCVIKSEKTLPGESDCDF